MKNTVTLFILFLFPFTANAQPYTVGTKNITWNDPARSNRAVTLEFRYPGTNAAVASGQFPFVIFAHGFQMDQVPYYPYSDSLAKQGYIVGLLTTETGLSPSHANFAQDLIFAYNKLIDESNVNTASPFYQKVIPKGALGGHSMGGGSTVLSAQYGNPAACYFTFAAANTNPSSIAAAPSMTKPYLAFAGSLDCVAPPATHQNPMYDSSGSPCKVYVNIKNGRHCAFGNSNFQCNFGEGFSGCASSPLSTADQINKCLYYLVSFLDYYLKGNCPAWTLFESRYNSNTVDSLRKSCTNIIPTNAAIAGNTTFCSGSNTTLTALPAGFNYTWNNSATSPTLSASSAGNYSVVVDNGVCSLPSVSVSVTENFPPAAPSAIVADDTVCSGIANIILSVVNNPLVTYNWSLPSGWSITQGANSNAIMVTSGNAGGVIEVTAENDCGISSPVQKTMTVVPSNLGTPGTVSGNNNVCDGEILNYSIATVAGADSYVWTLPQGWTLNAGATTEAITVTAGAASGNINVQAVNTCGQSVPASVAVTVNPLPQLTSIAGNTSLCIGETAVVTALHTNTTSINFIWKFPSSVEVLSTATDTAIIRAIGPAGTYADTLTVQNTCGITPPAYSTIMVHDTPTVTITQSGNDLIATGGVTCQWYKNGQLIAGADSLVYTPQESGIYSVVAISAEGCSGTSAGYNFVFTTSDALPDDFFSVVPNPAKDFVLVNTSSVSNAIFQLLSIDGRLLLSKQLTATSEKIWLHEIPSGMYVACLQAKSAFFRKRVVIE